MLLNFIGSKVVFIMELVWLFYVKMLKSKKDYCSNPINRIIAKIYYLELGDILI